MKKKSIAILVLVLNHHKYAVFLTTFQYFAEFLPRSHRYLNSIHLLGLH